jgi:hypothetical protein
MGSAAASARCPVESGQLTVHIEVPDVEAALAKAESLGGTRLKGMSRGAVGAPNVP